MLFLVVWWWFGGAVVCPVVVCLVFGGGLLGGLPGGLLGGESSEKTPKHISTLTPEATQKNKHTPKTHHNTPQHTPKNK
jgi:hypothetical protein